MIPTIQQPKDMTYQSKIWPNLSPETQTEIIQLKNLITDLDQSVNKPWEKPNEQYSSKAKNDMRSSLRRAENKYYFLMKKTGLTEEAKNFAKEKYGIKIINTVNNMQRQSRTSFKPLSSELECPF